MPETGRQSDAISIYLTGAAADGDPVTPADRHLGGFRSSERLAQRGLTSTRTIAGLAVEWASAGNPIGAGTLEAVGPNSLAWTPPGGDRGVPVRVATGQTRIVSGADPSAAVRVTRYGSRPLAGRAVVDCARIVAGALGMPDADTAGESRYHALILKNESPYAVTDLEIGLTPLGSPLNPDAFQLGASGAGTASASSLASVAWPSTGFARIVASVGGAVEIVYYERNTGSGIAVPAAGRGLFGTSPFAGAAGDTITPISPLRLASEEVAADGSIQTIADDETAPTGVSWTHDLIASPGITRSRIEPGGSLGLWMHRLTPAGAAATALIENAYTLNYRGA